MDTEPYLCIHWTQIDEDHYHADYTLNLPLKDTDIRRDEYPEGIQRILINSTDRTGGSPDKHGYLDTPFRDGSHMLWDSGRLRLVGYVAYNERKTAVCANGKWLDGYRGNPTD